jgi:hypothetical protein
MFTVTDSMELIKLSAKEIINRFGSKQAVYNVLAGLPEYESSKVQKCKTEMGKNIARLKIRVGAVGLKEKRKIKVITKQQEQFSLF